MFYAAESAGNIAPHVFAFLINLLTAYILYRRFRKEMEEKSTLLREEDSQVFLEAFRSHVLEQPSFKSYVQDVYPFREEPFDDAFLMERFGKTVKGSRLQVQAFLALSAFCTLAFIFLLAALAYLGAFSKLPWTTGTIIAIGIFAEILMAYFDGRMMWQYRLNLELAERFESVTGVRS